MAVAKDGMSALPESPRASMNSGRKKAHGHRRNLSEVEIRARSASELGLTFTYVVLVVLAQASLKHCFGEYSASLTLTCFSFVLRASLCAMPTHASSHRYEQLLVSNDGQRPEGVDPAHREAYLVDAEFERIFGMARAAFGALPVWKQKQIKRQHGLF